MSTCMILLHKTENLCSLFTAELVNKREKEDENKEYVVLYVKTTPPFNSSCCDTKRGAD